MLKRFWLLAIILTAGIGLAALPLYAQDPDSPMRVAPGVVAPQVGDIGAADLQLRDTVGGALRAAAARAGVALDPAAFMYVSRDDVVVANAATAAAETVTPAALRQGIDMMFVYLSVPTAELQQDAMQALPAGFYTVNLSTVPGSSIARARLRNEAGRVVAELPARLAGSGAPTSPVAKPKIKLTASLEDKKLVIDIEITWGSAAGAGRVDVPRDLAAYVEFALAE
jgi:hypothetical protein